MINEKISVSKFHVMQYFTRYFFPTEEETYNYQLKSLSRNRNRKHLRDDNKKKIIGKNRRFYISQYFARSFYYKRDTLRLSVKKSDKHVTA